MTCECALKKITNYIKRELSEKEEWEFIEHVEQCPQCLDELVFTFMMLEGLDMLDEGELGSMDFGMEIAKNLAERKKAISSRRKRLNWMLGTSSLIFVVCIILIVLILTL